MAGRGGTSLPRGAARAAARWRMVLIAVAILALAAVIAFQIAARHVRSRIETLLGPHAHWSAIDVGLRDIVITDFAEDALAGWPAQQELSARRVVIVTQLSSLIHRDPLVIASMTLTDGSATLVRERDGLQLFPVLLRKGETKPEPEQSNGVLIEKITFDNMRVNFYDRTVNSRNFDVALAPAMGTLSSVTLPTAGSTIGLSVSAPVLTPAGDQNGTFALSGTIQPKEGSDLTVELHSVGVQSLTPYVDKAGNNGIVGGRVELMAHSVVADSKINATGVLTLHDLRIAADGNLAERVAGLPRRIVIERLKDRQGDIVLHFTIAGDAHDPHFSLNENAATRFSAGLSEALGVPVDTLAKGVGTIGEESLGAVGDAVKGILPH